MRTKDEHSSPRIAGNEPGGETQLTGETTMLTKTKLALSAALILGTLSAATAESWDPVPGDRNPNPVGGLFENRSVYDARMQTGRSAPTIYIEKNQKVFDRNTQTFDGGGW
jgi:hypothetical protein